MGDGYSGAAWHDFAIAVAGASAALAGVLFVAMSINVKEIVADPHLPPRAAGAVVTLSTPMVFSILLLDPVRSSSALGVELIVLAILVGVVLGAMLRPRRVVRVRSTSNGWEGQRSRACCWRDRSCSPGSASSPRASGDSPG